MNELTKILLNSGLTIAGGAAVFGITKLHLEPINNLNKIRGEIATSLILNANKFGNPKLFKSELDEISLDLRKMAASLRAATYLIKFHWLYFILLLVPKRSKIITASENLIGLSNSVTDDNFEVINNYRGEVERLLKLK